MKNFELDRNVECTDLHSQYVKNYMESDIPPMSFHTNHPLWCMPARAAHKLPVPQRVVAHHKCIFECVHRLLFAFRCVFHDPFHLGAARLRNVLKSMDFRFFSVFSLNTFPTLWVLKFLYPIHKLHLPHFPSSLHTTLNLP